MRIGNTPGDDVVGKYGVPGLNDSATSVSYVDGARFDNWEYVSRIWVCIKIHVKG